MATGALLREVTSSVTSSSTGSLKVFMATGGSTGFSFLVVADSLSDYSVTQALERLSERHSFDFFELDRALDGLLASLIGAGILIFSDYARSMSSTTNEISVVSLTLYEPAAATVERRKYPGPALSSLGCFSTVFSGFLDGSETAGVALKSLQ